MQITNVSVAQGRRLIPVKGWDGVTKAITLFSNGYTRGSRETERVTGDAIEKSAGAMGLGLFLLSSVKVGGRSRLVDDLLKEAEERLRKQVEFDKSYDYDGMGTSFFKTSVTIKKFGGGDMYGIGLWAAYVGDEPEAGLADHLGIPRTLLSCNIEVETRPVSKNRFEFDFEPVLRKLNTVLDIKNLTGKQVAKAMLQKDESGDDRGSFILAERDGLRVYIQPGRVERRMVFDRATRRDRDTWSFKDSIFSGELARDYDKEDENAKVNPTFLIVVSSTDQIDLGYRKETRPMWHPDQQQKAIDLANKIAAALQ